MNPKKVLFNHRYSVCLYSLLRAALKINNAARTCTWKTLTHGTVRNTNMERVQGGELQLEIEVPNILIMSQSLEKKEDSVNDL